MLEVVIDESANFVLPESGFMPRRAAYGSLSYAQTFPFDLVPRLEWPARIEQLQDHRQLLSHIITRAALPCKDQGDTKFDFTNALVHGIEIVQLLLGRPQVVLSAASVACRLTNFRNRGEFGTEAVAYVAKYGVVPASYWPSNSLSRQFDTPEAWQEALQYRIPKWYDLKPLSLDELISLLFLRIPVIAEYNWLARTVVACDPVLLDVGKYGVRVRLCAGPDVGQDGFIVLAGNRALPDSALAPAIFDLDPSSAGPAERAANNLSTK